MECNGGLPGKQIDQVQIILAKRIRRHRSQPKHANCFISDEQRDANERAKRTQNSTPISVRSGFNYPEPGAVYAAEKRLR